MLALSLGEAPSHALKIDGLAAPNAAGVIMRRLKTNTASSSPVREVSMPDFVCCVDALHGDQRQPGYAAFADGHTGSRQSIECIAAVQYEHVRERCSLFVKEIPAP